MENVKTFEFEQILNFFKNHHGDTYVAPKKTGAERNLMLELKDNATQARYSFIEFAKKLSESFIDLKYDNKYKCSRWFQDAGKGKPKKIHHSLWIQLKNPEWSDDLASVSLSLNDDYDSLDVRVDVAQDNLSKLSNKNPELYKKILERQFHLLDVPLKDNTEYRIREEDYHTYDNHAVEAIKERYKNHEIKPLIQVGTTIELLFHGAFRILWKS